MLSLFIKILCSPSIINEWGVLFFNIFFNKSLLDTPKQLSGLLCFYLVAEIFES